jgi:hypothetical protein
MSLSSVNVFNLFFKALLGRYTTYESCLKIDYYFRNFLNQNYSKIVVPKVFKNWHGIDSGACYLVLYISEKSLKNPEDIIIPKDFDSGTLLRIYSLINSEFRKCCKEEKIDEFISLAALEKKLKLREVLK